MQRGHEFKDRLAEIISEREIGTLALSEAIGVRAETIRRWKKGVRSIKLKHLVKLADYFRCSVEYLLGRTEKCLDFKIQTMPTFYESLLRVMSEKKKTRYGIVNDLPIYDSYFTNWSRGKSPKAETLTMLADYLGVTVDYLIGREKNGTLRNYEIIDSKSL